MILNLFLFPNTRLFSCGFHSDVALAASHWDTLCFYYPEVKVFSSFPCGFFFDPWVIQKPVA